MGRKEAGRLGSFKPCKPLQKQRSAVFVLARCFLSACFELPLNLSDAGRPVPCRLERGIRAERLGSEEACKSMSMVPVDGSRSA